MTKTAFLLKEEFAPDAFNTLAGLNVVAEDIRDGTLSIAADGVFVGSMAHQTVTDRALSRCPRKYELSFSTGQRLRGKFRIAHMSYRGEIHGERMYRLNLVSEGRVEAVQ